MQKMPHPYQLLMDIKDNCEDAGDGGDYTQFKAASYSAEGKGKLMHDATAGPHDVLKVSAQSGSLNRKQKGGLKREVDHGQDLVGPSISHKGSGFNPMQNLKLRQLIDRSQGDMAEAQVHEICIRDPVGARGDRKDLHLKNWGTVESYESGFPDSSGIQAKAMGSNCHHTAREGTLLDMTSSADESSCTDVPMGSLSAKEYQFRSFFKSSPDGFLLADESGSIIEWNWMMEKLTGLSMSEVIGKPLWDVYPEASCQIRGKHGDLPGRKPAIRDFCETGNGSSHLELHEGSVVVAGGQARAMQVAMFPIKGNNGLMIGGIFRDAASPGPSKRLLSSIAAKPDASSILECKAVLDGGGCAPVKFTEGDISQAGVSGDQSLYSMSTEARNSLQVISNLVRCPKEDVLDERQNRTRSIALIYDVLSRSPDPDRIAFGYYISRLTDVIARSQEAISVSFRLKMDEAMLRTGSAISCGLIINELISNSLKHTFPDSGKGDIAIEFRSLGADIYIISISDNSVNSYGQDSLDADGSLIKMLEPLIEEIDGRIVIDKVRGSRVDICFNELKYNDVLKKAQAELHKVKGKISRG